MKRYRIETFLGSVDAVKADGGTISVKGWYTVDEIERDEEEGTITFPHKRHVSLTVPENLVVVREVQE